MTKKDGIELYNLLSIEELISIKGYTKFQYASIRNKKILKDEVDSINSIIKPFTDDKDGLVLKYSTKDKNDKPVVKNGTISIQMDVYPDFLKELEEIEAKHKDLLDEYKNIIKEELKVELRTITIDDIEDLPINGRELDILLLMIKE